MASKKAVRIVGAKAQATLPVRFRKAHEALRDEVLKSNREAMQLIMRYIARKLRQEHDRTAVRKVGFNTPAGKGGYGPWTGNLRRSIRGLTRVKGKKLVQGAAGLDPTFAKRQRTELPPNKLYKQATLFGWKSPGFAAIDGSYSPGTTLLSWVMDKGDLESPAFLDTDEVTEAKYQKLKRAGKLSRRPGQQKPETDDYIGSEQQFSDIQKARKIAFAIALTWQRMGHVRRPSNFLEQVLSENPHTYYLQPRYYAAVRRFEEMQKRKGVRQGATKYASVVRTG